jgi:hypothetical protein
MFAPIAPRLNPESASRDQSVKSDFLSIHHGTRKGVSLVLLAGFFCFGHGSTANAICGLDGAANELIRLVDDQAILSNGQQKLGRNSCMVCHLAGSGGPRNSFGSAVNTLLSVNDREDSVRQREAGRRMVDILLDLSSPNSPTFGELFQRGRLPPQLLIPDENPMPDLAPRVPVNVTVEQARQWVKETQSQSPFGILQLSRTLELSPETAGALAEFRGEMLILGLKTLAPEVAEALATSQAATLWLHSVTSVSPEVAASLAKTKGKLVLSGLSELSSVPLAEKLVSRPGALSFPFLTSISPEIAEVLAKSSKSLTLAGLTRVPLEVQEKLAQTPGALYLPNLQTLDSLPLAAKLTSGFVVLSQVEKISAEQAKLLPKAKGAASFFGGIVLPMAAVTPEVAAAFMPDPNGAVTSPVNLILVGDGPLSDDAFRTLLQSRISLTLPHLGKLSSNQKRILSELSTERKTQPGLPPLAPLILPGVKELDLTFLAQRLVGGGNGFVGVQGNRGITTLSAEVAAALGSLPDHVRKLPDGTEVAQPTGSLNFPGLDYLAPETARLLLRKRWLEISLPSLEDLSLETIRLMARQTSRLTLGLSTLPAEFAGAFAEMPMVQPMAGDSLSFPCLTELSPEAARILVTSLNRGFRDVPNGKFSNSPRLSLGGVSGFATLAPELAVELAKYEGNLAIEGLGELPDESAAALANFPGPYLFLSGPGVEKLSPAAAESLAKASAILQIPLRQLDSKSLAERIVRQRGNSTLYNLEIVSNEAATALSQSSGFLNIRKLRVLESPDLARRFLADPSSGGITLPVLDTISAEAAGIIATSTKPLFLGLTVIDSTEVATALANARQRVTLPRLRAATADVMKILSASEKIKLPEEPPYLLSTESN